MVAEAIQEVAQVQDSLPPLRQWDSVYIGAEELAPAEDYREEVGSVKVDADFFLGLQDLRTATSGDQTRVVITGILVKPHGDGLILVATDTYRLWTRTVDAENVNLPAEGVIIPGSWVKKELPGIIKANGGKRGFGWQARGVTLTLYKDTHITTHKRRTVSGGWRNTVTEEHEDLVRVSFVSQVLQVGTAGLYSIDLTEGQFVNFPKVTPDAATADSVLEVKANVLLEGLKWCGAVAECHDNKVRLDVAADGIAITAAACDGVGKAFAEYPIAGPQVDLQGRGFAAQVNYRYLLDFLTPLEGAFVKFHHWQDGVSEWNGEAYPKAVLLTSGENAYVLMQMIDPK